MMVTGGLSDLHDGHDRVQVINIWTTYYIEVHDTRLHSRGTVSQEPSHIYTTYSTHINESD